MAARAAALCRGTVAEGKVGVGPEGAGRGDCWVAVCRSGGTTDKCKGRQGKEKKSPSLTTQPNMLLIQG